MRLHSTAAAALAAAVALAAGVPAATAQTGLGSIAGTVTIGDDARPLPDARVTVLRLRRTTVSGPDGSYRFDGVPPGRYDVSAHLERVRDVATSVRVDAGATATADLKLLLSTVSEQVTVTATGDEQLTSSSIQSVSVVGSDELARDNPVSLGEALDHQLGVAKRSYGPGNARPVVRGFDGDRVLVLQNGMRIGSLGFQSGDHAEPIDVLGLERIEIVKGPATLLYGSSAIGGVVNAIQGHETAQPGVRGYFTALGGTNNDQAGASGGVEFGTDHWLFWGGGSAQRAGEYDTPIGRVRNSYTRDGGLALGFGFYPEKGWVSFTADVDDREYGIPYDKTEEDPEIVFLDPHRSSYSFDAGLRDLETPLVRGARFSAQYNDYSHHEIDAITLGTNTSFSNEVFVYSAVADQRRAGTLSGSFGVWGLHRDYSSEGEEALAPPSTQSAFAAYTLQTLDFERAVLQFGGRVERNAYSAEVTPERGVLPDRSFTGFSGSVGVRVPLGDGFSFVTNYSHSYRAPALEELYNDGPHPGNLAFEIGDPNLRREAGDGIDVGLRHSSERTRAEASFFTYRLSDFVYLAPTGEVDDDLFVAEYRQADSRYTGVEAMFDAELARNLWVRSELDYVRATILATDTPLPRIPPLRGRIGLEYAARGFRVFPEVVMADRQDRVFPTETETAGYATVDVTASYTFAREHSAQIVSFNAFNLGDRLYRNNLSFIKEFAPEIGRGVRVAYTVRFF